MLALLGVLAFGVGVIQGLVFAVRSLVTRPVPSIAVLAVLGGRYAGADFSLEYPTGWRQRDDYGGSEHWELLENQPATVGGLPGREFVVRGATHVAHLFITVREQRGYIVLAQACQAGEGAREELLWDVARSFRF